MEAKSKENAERLQILEHSTKESMDGYQKMLEAMSIKHEEDLEKLISDQKEKIDADQ
jgi:hypothetical protein